MCFEEERGGGETNIEKRHSSYLMALYIIIIE